MQTGGETVTITVSLSGFNTSVSTASHGFHVHENGDLANNCIAAGGHYNPLGVTHGAPNDIIRYI
jgi:Cu-Zn family superoxide dismutase